jgi:hypothetical protein
VDKALRLFAKYTPSVPGVKVELFVGHWVLSIDLPGDILRETALERLPPTAAPHSAVLTWKTSGASLAVASMHT